MQKLISFIISFVVIFSFIAIYSSPTYAEVSSDMLSDRYFEWRSYALKDEEMFHGFMKRNEHYFLKLQETYNYADNPQLTNGVGFSAKLCTQSEWSAIMMLQSPVNYANAFLILDKYYPGYSTSMVNLSGVTVSSVEMSETTYCITDRRNASDMFETMNAVCEDLSAANLISAFYMPDAVWQEYRLISIPYLTCYSTGGRDNLLFTYAEPFDAEKVQQYIDKNNISASVQLIATGRSQTEYYYVIPHTPLSLQEHFALAIQLYKELGIVPKTELQPDSTIGKVAVTQNMLETVGDVNGDFKFDLADVVLYQRWLAADTAILNANWKSADLNYDGRLTSTDLTLMKNRIIYIE